MTEYGEALARYRFEAGLNQRELGAAIGLDSTHVNKIERGHRPPLGAKYMKPLVRALRLRRSEAENLVDLAGLPRKVLDFMDEVADGQAKDDDFTFGSPLKTPQRYSDEAAQLRQLLAQVDALRTSIEALIAEKEQRNGRTERP